MTVTIRHFGKHEIIPANDIMMAAFNSPENRVKDLNRLLEIQPDGWFMALDDGIPVGTVGAIEYEAFAWIGMMAVNPDKQGGGIGKKLMQVLLDWLESHGNQISLLDATPLGEPLYQRFSFREVDRAVQFVKFGHSPKNEAFLDSVKSGPSMALQEGIKVMTETDIPDVAKFDSAYFGANRKAVFAVYLHDYPNRAFIAYTPSGKMGGYIMVQDRKIGPWVAESAEVAERLLHTALTLEYYGEDPAVIAPAINSRAKKILEKNGFQSVRSLSHMQRGGVASPIRREFIFGQTSFAIG